MNLTPEKKKKLDKLGMQFAAKSFLSGIHHGLMAAAMNIILFMGVAIFFDRDETAMTVGTIAIGIFIIRRMLKIYSRNVVILKEEADKIIKS